MIALALCQPVCILIWLQGASRWAASAVGSRGALFQRGLFAAFCEKIGRPPQKGILHYEGVEHFSRKADPPQKKNTWLCPGHLLRSELYVWVQRSPAGGGYLEIATLEAISVGHAPIFGAPLSLKKKQQHVQSCPRTLADGRNGRDILDQTGPF